MSEIQSNGEKTVPQKSRRPVWNVVILVLLSLIAGGGAVVSGRILQARLSPPTRTPTATIANTPILAQAESLVPTVQVPPAEPSHTETNTPTVTANHGTAQQTISPGMAEKLVELKKLTDADGATDLAFTPDGGRLLTDGLTGVHLYGLPDLANLNFRPTQSLVRTVAVSPQGNRAAYNFDDGSIRMWNLTTGGDGPYTVKHKEPVYGLAFSPDGKLLASASRDGTIHIWDTESMLVRKEMKGHVETAWAVAFSPDGKKLASASSDHTVRIWDVESGRSLAVLEGHSAEVYSVAFSPDGTMLASGSQDGTIILWDPATWNQLRSLAGTVSGIFSIAFSPDGRVLLSGSDDGTIRLWEPDRGDLSRLVTEYDPPVTSVAFSPQGTLFAAAVGDNTIRLWAVNS